TGPLFPDVTSGRNEMYPAGTGLPLKNTLPDSWAFFSGGVQPPATSKAPVTTVARHARARAVRLIRGSPQGTNGPRSVAPVSARRQAVLGIAVDLPGRCADGRADGAHAAGGLSDVHHVALEAVGPAVVAGQGVGGA